MVNKPLSTYPAACGSLPLVWVITFTIVASIIFLEEGRYLPYLALSSEENIFIPNAAIWLILPPAEELSGKVREVLEMESTLLSPSLALLLGSNLKSEKVKSSVLSALQSLNSTLEGSQFLVKVRIFAFNFHCARTMWRHDAILDKIYNFFSNSY